VSNYRTTQPTGFVKLFRGVAVPPFLGAQIRHRIVNQGSRRRWLPQLASVGAAAAFVLIAALRGSWPSPYYNSSQDSYIASVSTQVAT